MKKRVVLLFLCGLLLVSACASAANIKNKYSLSTKKGTALQSVPDREISPKTQPQRHVAIPGESPVTGLPWEGEYRPMLVQISNAVDSVKTKKGTVKSAGLGKRALWGAQYADIFYEQILYRTGETRFILLFSDSLAQEQPMSVGPVRSGRIGALYLREEWQAGFVYSAHGWSGGSADAFFKETGVKELGVLFELSSGKYQEHRNRVQGVKAPDNYNVNLVGMQGEIPDTYISTPRPFLFAEESPYSQGYAKAQTIHLDWGKEQYISHFQYDPATNSYLRFCGPKLDASKWAPFVTYASAEDRSEENQVQLAFSNLIVQRMEYSYWNNNKIMPIMRGVAKGNADIFIGGRYIPGYWICESFAGSTVFYDDQGNELMLGRGKTYIAQLPPESLCLFMEE